MIQSSWLSFFYILIKTVFLSILFFFVVTQVDARKETLRNPDINLENYEYPFPVSFLKPELQGEKLQMAYMDVKPEKPNAKSVVLLPGKISTVLTEKKRLKP